MAQPSDTVSLRITLRYKDLDEFVNRYAENISSAGLFLRTKSPKATGTKIRFELLLADGSRALRGEGVVVTVREDDKPGMALRFKMLDADSQAVIDRIVAKHGQGTLAPTPLSTNLGRPSYGGAAARPTSTPNWRASSGWVSMSNAPRVPGQGERPGSGSGVIPRRASRTFDAQPKKPIPREPSGSHAIPRAPLPRQRSSVTRPWGSGEREATGRIRVSDFASAREDTGSLSKPTLAPIGDSGAVEDDRTLRMDVDRLRTPSSRGETTVDSPRGVGEAQVATDEFVADVESDARFARAPSASANGAGAHGADADAEHGAGAFEERGGLDDAADIEPGDGDALDAAGDDTRDAAEHDAADAFGASSDDAGGAHDATNAYGEASDATDGDASGADEDAVGAASDDARGADGVALGAASGANGDRAHDAGAFGATNDDASGDDAASGHALGAASDARGDRAHDADDEGALGATSTDARGDDAAGGPALGAANDAGGDGADDEGALDAARGDDAAGGPALGAANDAGGDGATDEGMLGATRDDARDANDGDTLGASSHEARGANDAGALGATSDHARGDDAAGGHATDDGARGATSDDAHGVDAFGAASDARGVGATDEDLLGAATDEGERGATSDDARGGDAAGGHGIDEGALRATSDGATGAALGAASDERRRDGDALGAARGDDATDEAALGASHAGADHDDAADDDGAGVGFGTDDDDATDAYLASHGEEDDALGDRAGADDAERGDATDDAQPGVGANDTRGGDDAASLEAIAAESAAHFGLDRGEDADPMTAPAAAPGEDDPWADALGIPPTQPPTPAQDAWRDATDETPNAPATLEDPNPEAVAAATESDDELSSWSAAEVDSERPAWSAATDEDHAGAAAPTHAGEDARAEGVARPEPEAGAERLDADGADDDDARLEADAHADDGDEADAGGDAAGDDALARAEARDQDDAGSEPDARADDDAEALGAESDARADDDAVADARARAESDAGFDADAWFDAGSEAADAGSDAVAASDPVAASAPDTGDDPARDEAHPTDTFAAASDDAATPVLGVADAHTDDAPRDTEANAQQLREDDAVPDVTDAPATDEDHDPTRADVRAYPSEANDDAYTVVDPKESADEVDEFEASFAEVGDEIRRQVAEEDALADSEIDDDPTAHIPYPSDRDGVDAPSTEEIPAPLRGADAFDDEPTAHILSTGADRIDPSVVDPAAARPEPTDRTEPPAEAMEDAPTAHIDRGAAPDDAMDDDPTRFDTRQGPRVADFTDGEETAAIAAHPIPSDPHGDDEAETKVRVSSVDESDAVVPVPNVALDEEATRHERPEDPLRAYDEAPTNAEIQREPLAARPAEPYAEAATVHAPETQVVRTRKLRADEDPARVSLDASTEIVKAHDATAPRDGTPMYSTEVQVTGVASDAKPHEEVAPTRPRPKSFRAAIERESSRPKNPEEMLRKAREAAFSEEATEVPPERGGREQVAKRPAEEPPKRRAPPTEQIRARGPQAPSRAQRVIGIDFGGQWVRMGLLEGPELELIPAAASAYIPALVATRKDGSLVTGVKARALVLDDPRRGTSPRSVLQAIENGKVPPGRTEALNVIGSGDGEVKLRLGDHVVDLQDVLVTYFAFLRDAIEQHLSTDTFSAALLVPDDLDKSARDMIEAACKTARLDLARLVPESQAMLSAYNLLERPVKSALLIDVGMTHVGIRVAQRGDNGFDIVASRWDDKLSAGAFDDRVVQLTLDELQAQAGEDHQADRTARLRLKEAVEHARLDIRRAASVELKVTLPAPGGASGVVVERSITLPRSRIYQVTEDVVLDICVAVQEVLRDAGIDPRRIDTTILAGSGGTFPPLIEALMNLTQQEPQHSIPPAQVFAMGLAKSSAAIERAEVASQPNTLSASIGFGLPGGRFRPILQAGSKLPVSISKSYPTTKDGQTDVELKFYQGDAEFVRTCTFLGELTLTGLPRAIRGEVRIDLDLAVAADGVLSVRLGERTNQVQEKLTVATAQTPNERRRSLAARKPAVAQEPPQKTGGFFKRLFGRK